jgi:hypothetical protein
MKLKTRTKAGIIFTNHNQKKAKTKVKAGALVGNHNQSR